MRQFIFAIVATCFASSAFADAKIISFRAPTKHTNESHFGYLSPGGGIINAEGTMGIWSSLSNIYATADANGKGGVAEGRGATKDGIFNLNGISSTTATELNL